MIPSNPFPDYPVTRLDDDPTSVAYETIPTEPIEQSRKYLDDYLSQWLRKKDSSDEIDVAPLIISVKGDYGTGKTHLLLDAAAQMQQKLSSNYPTTAILRFPCIEGTPEQWFRTTIGPQLKPKSIERRLLRDTVVGLYARAAESVAGQAKMTASAINTLQEDPYSIYALVNEDLLNATAVNREFRTLLSNVCSDVSEEVQRALRGFVSPLSSSIATSWLAGETLDPTDAKTLRVEPSFSTENNARDVLVALANVRSYLDYPFGLMIDELEHLTRYDETHRSKRNLTWLKRLLEGLGKCQILIYIAGHWTAWDTKLEEDAEGDFLGRFSYRSEIALTRLSPDDVLDVVQARVRGLRPEYFGRSQAEAVLDVAKPNTIRRILSLCRVLYDSSNGFQVSLSSKEIGRLAAQAAQRITIDNVALPIREFFEQRGLAVRHGDFIKRDIQFDLVAYQEQPKVAIEFKHSILPLEHVRAATRFIDRMQEVQQDSPEIIGCFVCDGSVDEEVMSILRSARSLNILAFDLNELNFGKIFAQELESSLKSSSQVEQKLKELLERKATLEEQEEKARSSDRWESVEQLHVEREVLDEQIAELQQKSSARLQESTAHYRKIQRALTAVESQREKEHQQQQAYQNEYASTLGERGSALITPPDEREVIGARLENTYAELTKPVPLSKKLRLALSNNSSLLFMLVFWGVVSLISAVIVSNTFLSYEASELLLYALSLIGMFCLLYALFTAWRLLAALNTYLDFEARMLREVYIRSSSPQDLVRAYNILRLNLEARGPVNGLATARRELAETMPQYIGSPQNQASI
jgi:hypothetical protein